MLLAKIPLDHFLKGYEHALLVYAKEPYEVFKAPS